MNELARKIVIGLEVETYSINVSSYSIGRSLSRPRPGLSEDGEQFSRDTSIGSEYKSRPYATVREAFFLLKTGLRKYLRRLYRAQKNFKNHNVPLLVGGWMDRAAGAHMHISVAGREMTPAMARSLAWHIHDHIPLLIALGANSPIWDRKMTAVASNRVLRGSRTYFRPIRRGRLSRKDNEEMVFNRGRKTKPPTLELRIFDSNLPEFLVASLCVVKAIALRWLKDQPSTNRVLYADYLRARVGAALRGTRCRIPWGGEWLSLGKYLDRFVREYREELEQMDVPDEIFDVLRLAKRGYNGARIVREACHNSIRVHPQTWQKRFAKRYESGLGTLLSGNLLATFAKELKVRLPNTGNVWLGRRGGAFN